MSIPIATCSAIVSKQFTRTFQQITEGIQASKNETRDAIQALREETREEIQASKNETRDAIQALRNETQKGFRTVTQQLGTLSNTLGILVENQVRSCLTKRNYSESNVRGEKLVCLRDLATSICRKETMQISTSSRVFDLWGFGDSGRK
jgi:hypothetical protein